MNQYYDPATFENAELTTELPARVLDAVKAKPASAYPPDLKKLIEGREKDVLAALGIEWPPKRGQHINCPLPGHDDKKPSWRWDADDRRWFCTCGSGSIFDAVMRMKGCDFKDACAWIWEEVLNGSAPAKKSANGASEPAPISFVPALRMPSNSDLRHAQYGIPSRIWVYHDAEQQIVEARARYDLKDNSKPDKVVLPWIWNGKRWLNEQMPGLRPLYALPVLLDETEATVVFVEGEKDAEGGEEKFQAANLVFTTTSGGGNAHAWTDYAPLKGRRVVIWPDNDKVGLAYKEAVADHAVEAGAASVKVVAVPAHWRNSKGKAWGLGDPPPDGVTLVDLVSMLDDAAEWPPSEDAAVPQGELAFLGAAPERSAPRKTGVSAEWPKPEPLWTSLKPEPYPTAALPGGIREAVMEVIGYVQCPDSLGAVSALSALSLAGQGTVNVCRDATLIGPVSLYCLMILDSGERKSTADQLFKLVIEEFEREQAEIYEPKVREHEADVAAWKAEHSGITSAITRNKKEAKSTTELKKQLTEHQSREPVPLRVPRLVFENNTAEALAYELHTGWPVGGIMSPEGGIVFGGHGMRPESIMLNLTTLNKAWDGAEHTVHRRTSKSFKLRGARLSMGIAAQTGVVRAFMEKNGVVRDTGFAARFLIAWPDGTAGSRPYCEPPPDWPGLSQFNRRIKSILKDAPKPGPKGEIAFVALEFSSEAKATWIEVYNDIELAMARGKEFAELKDVASKAADNVARLAALFHLYAHGTSGKISDDNVRRAAEIVVWHLTEAKRFLQTVALPIELSHAIKLDEWLIEECREKGVTQIPAVEILRFGPFVLRNAEVRDKAFSKLVAAGRARMIKEGQNKIIMINPELLEYEDE